MPVNRPTSEHAYFSDEKPKKQSKTMSLDEFARTDEAAAARVGPAETHPAFGDFQVSRGSDQIPNPQHHSARRGEGSADHADPSSHYGHHGQIGAQDLTERHQFSFSTGKEDAASDALSSSNADLGPMGPRSARDVDQSGASDLGTGALKARHPDSDGHRAVVSANGMAVYRVGEVPFAGVSRKHLFLLTFGRQSGSLVIDGEVHALSPRMQNSVTYLPPECSFKLTLQTQGDVLALEVENLPIFEGTDQESAVPLDATEPLILQNNAAMMETARFARRWLLSRQLGGVLYASALSQMLMCHGVDMLMNPAREAPGMRRRLCDKQLAAIKTHIETHLDDEIPVSILAASVGLSTSHFARSFKDVTGETPHHYIIKTRIERAKALLCQTKTSLSEVAYTVGFSSQAHMTDTFRRIAGITPGRYRRVNHREGASLGALASGHKLISD